MVKKWPGNGLGFSRMTCPKSGQKAAQKVIKNGLSKIWGRKAAPKVVKKMSKNCFLANRQPKRGAAAVSRRAPFWVAAEGRHLYLPKNIFWTTF